MTRSWLRFGAGVMILGLAYGAVRWRYAVVTVRGPSMEPDLFNGDRLLVRRCRVERLRPGQHVIFREPGLPRRRPVALTGAGQDVWVVKRVAAVSGDQVPASVRAVVSGVLRVPPRNVVVLGNEVASRDSRYWGFIPSSQIFGLSICRLRHGSKPTVARL
jgi:signal peptidase I